MMSKYEFFQKNLQKFKKWTLFLHQKQDSIENVLPTAIMVISYS